MVKQAGYPALRRTIPQLPRALLHPTSAVNLSHNIFTEPVDQSLFLRALYIKAFGIGMFMVLFRGYMLLAQWRQLP